MNNFEFALSATFLIKLLRQLGSFVGWTIHISRSTIKVYQRIYTRALLKEVGIDETNGVYIPLPINADVNPKRDDEEFLTIPEHSRHRLKVGGLLYLSVGTRPDLSFPISVLARLCNAPTKRNLA